MSSCFQGDFKDNFRLTISVSICHFGFSFMSCSFHDAGVTNYFASAQSTIWCTYLMDSTLKKGSALIFFSFYLMGTGHSSVQKHLERLLYAIHSQKYHSRWRQASDSANLLILYFRRGTTTGHGVVQDEPELLMDPRAAVCAETCCSTTGALLRCRFVP